MRPLQLGNPGPTLEAKVDWLIQAVKKIEVASQDDTDQIWDQFTMTNVTESYSFDASTVTTQELADIIGTLITKYKQRIG